MSACPLWTLRSTFLFHNSHPYCLLCQVAFFFSNLIYNASTFNPDLTGVTFLTALEGLSNSTKHQGVFYCGHFVLHVGTLLTHTYPTYHIPHTPHTTQVHITHIIQHSTYHTPHPPHRPQAHMHIPYHIHNVSEAASTKPLSYV